MRIKLRQTEEEGSAAAEVEKAAVVGSVKISIAICEHQPLPRPEAGGEAPRGGGARSPSLANGAEADVVDHIA